MKEKPDLSFWKLWNISFGFFGVQIAYALQSANISRIFATLGVVFPSLVIIMIIAAFIQNFAHLPAVQNAFAGIRVCVCVLILNAVVKLWKKSVVDWKTFLIFLLVFAGSVFLNISPVLYVLAAALAGIVVKELEARKA